jgi:hypothetical protein
MKGTLSDWSPRVMLMAFAAFISVFALDVFDGRGGFWTTAAALFMHLLPTFLLLLIVALAWRRPWLGGLACLALAAWYVSWAAPRFPWTVLLMMAGPLLLVSGLYAWSWASRRRLHLT